VRRGSFGTLRQGLGTGSDGGARIDLVEGNARSNALRIDRRSGKTIAGRDFGCGLVGERGRDRREKRQKHECRRCA